jgi:transcriptional regulator with XRE-family HTH domain
MIIKYIDSYIKSINFTDIKQRLSFLSMEPIGKKLEKFRKNKNLTLREMAMRINVPVSTYRNWEYGRNIKGEPYLKITKVLNISLNELFGIEPFKSSEEIMKKLKIIKQQAELIEKNVQSLFKLTAHF